MKARAFFLSLVSAGTIWAIVSELELKAIDKDLGAVILIGSIFLLVKSIRDLFL